MARMQINFHLYAENVSRAALFYGQNFGFKLEGQIEADKENGWAALRAENALLWLSPQGAKTGLIILIDEKLEELVLQLKHIGTTVLIPEELNKDQLKENDILTTEWGRHSWMLDSEDNVVMLFEPLAG